MLANQYTWRLRCSYSGFYDNTWTKSGSHPRGDRQAQQRTLALTWKGSQLESLGPWEVSRIVSGRQAGTQSIASSAFLKAINSHLSCSIDLLCGIAASVIFFFKPYNWDLSLNLEIGCAGANLFHFLIKKKKNLYCLLPLFLPVLSLSSPWWEAIPQCVGVSGQTVPTALPHTPVSFHYDYPKCKDHLRFTPCLWPFSDGFPLDHSLDPV